MCDGQVCLPWFLDMQAHAVFANKTTLFSFSDYLKGLDCFEQPTQKAKQCMEEMTLAITDLSTKQITQKLNMDSFFADFCT